MRTPQEITIIELENSENLTDRQEYADRIKMYIERMIAENKQLEFQFEMTKEDSNQVLIEINRKAIKGLKDKLSNYDVYRQRFIYKCGVCREEFEKCLCAEIFPEKPKPIEIKQEKLL